MLIVLSYAIFMFASNGLAQIEMGLIPYELGDFYSMIATIGIVGFTFSILRLYQRAMGFEVKGDHFVTQLLRKVTTHKNRANRKRGD